MKVLIWIGCFIVATILNTILGYATGIKVGYLLFYFAVYFVAKKLCSMWDEHSFESIPVPDAGWRCSCGRPHPRYETSCICGKSKFESITCPQPEAASTETTDQILFCRKCGAKLLTDSQFCSKCGTEIIEI